MKKIEEVAFVFRKEDLPKLLDFISKYDEKNCSMIKIQKIFKEANRVATDEYIVYHWRNLPWKKTGMILFFNCLREQTKIKFDFARVTQKIVVSTKSQTTLNLNSGIVSIKNSICIK